MESVKYDFLTNPLFIFTVLIGGSVLVLLYFINLFRNQEVAEKPKNEKSTAQTEKKKDLPIGGKRKKKIPESRWTGKHEKHTYTHPWLLVTLKGHTGNILDMDFSSNGKYLISCDDEDPDPGGDTTQVTIARESNKDSDRSEEPSPRSKGLSRRQRKNRRREDSSPMDVQKLKKTRSKKTEGTPILNKKQNMSEARVNQFLKFRKSEKTFTEHLRHYLLTLEQMISMGYPIQSSSDSALVVIYKSPRVPVHPIHKTRFDVNAREFVPKNDWSSNDSGQGSGSSSDSGENFDSEESTSSSDQDSTTSFSKNVYRETPFKQEGSNFTRICIRCTRIFYTTADEYITKEKCCYHWGRLQPTNPRIKEKPAQLAYQCCHGKAGSKGCTEAKVHVWSGLHVGMNGLYDDFVYTKQRKNPPADGNYGAYSLDCEMCYTVRGLELTKVTVVGMDGRLVYDSFVKPDEEIVDYNTRFSGITAKDLKRNITKSLREVQNDLMGFINAKTILIGHGLENDLRALKIVHGVVVDTSYWFPHFNGLPYRRSLRSLTSSFLMRDIQSGGHNSYEDACACMELMLWRVRNDFLLDD